MGQRWDHVVDTIASEERTEPRAGNPVGPVSLHPLDPARRERLTFFAEDGWIREVTFYCPHRDRALTVEECLACRHCRGNGAQPTMHAGCADPMARRYSGEELLRAPRPRSLADRTPLWQVMRPCVVCVGADLPLDALFSVLVGFSLRAVPVVDSAGRPVGVVSRSDLVEHMVDGEGAAPRTVGEVMMCVGFTLSEDASLSHAAALMAYEGVHRIPVVSFEGKVVGLVTSMDVVRWLAQHDGYVVPDSRARDA